MSRTTLLRRLAPVALLATSALVLGACGSNGKTAGKDASSSSSSPSASASAAADGCTDYSPGDASDSVKVTGEFGKKQTATFPTPLKAADIQRTVLDKGTGKTTAKGQKVDLLISVYLGKDGKALGSEPVSLTVGDTSVIPAFTAGIDCVPIGSRVVVAAPARDMYGDQGNAQLGITADDTIVIVSDVLGETKALVPSAWKKDVPKITFDASGKPTVKLPDTKPPADLQLKVLRQGDGAVVKAGDTVTVDYQGTSWDSGKIFDQSYGKQPASFATDKVVPGFGAALIGQKVGTRVAVVIPPKYAYGEKGSGQQLAGQTLVFVIDIKDTAPTPAQ